MADKRLNRCNYLGSFGSLLGLAELRVFLHCELPENDEAELKQSRFRRTRKHQFEMPKKPHGASNFKNCISFQIPND
jgi:hypothetical protein